MNLQHLKQCTLDELEAIYAQPVEAFIPTGRYWGHHLMRLDRPGSRRPWHAVSQPFAFVPFGVDFDARKWFFFHPALKIGRFTPYPCPSRWRDAPTIGLHYDASRLPGFAKGLLYDEVKPLSESLCLGIGGINAKTGQGDHLFFVLQRI